MREIKFRAWDEERKMMYYGDEIESRDDLIAALSYGQLVIFRVTDSEYTELNPLQYTELQDRNGKDIYEGDIYHQGDKNIRYVVVWADTGLIGKQSGTSSYVGLRHWRDRIEVIGNRYSNPELLGEVRE